MSELAPDLVRRTVDREAQRCGISRRQLAGWLLRNNWTPERFLEEAKSEPEWCEVFKAKPLGPNPWDKIVQQMKAKAERRSKVLVQVVDNYQDFSDYEDGYDEVYDTQLANAELPERADDMVECRLFYAWQQWKQQLREHEERTGRRLSPHAYRRARAVFAEKLKHDYGKSQFTSSWEERHLKWHKDRGTDPR